MYNPFTLQGKKILVTGSSSGIGRATALECSRLGAQVVLSARNIKRLEETLSMMEGDKSIHQILVADLTVQEELNELVKRVPVLDGIVLCSGRTGNALPIKFDKREKINPVFEANFFAPFELMRSLYKSKKLKNGASVVTIASIGGVKAFATGNGDYGAAKAALNSIMKFAAKEFAAKGIRVNCICPGMIQTPMVDSCEFSEEQLKTDIATYPLKRYGKPEEVAYGAVYLLSDATVWVTGIELYIDGGVTVL
ncbi:SDR family NAD(P)-dependent oxidoreductase [Prevotella sp. Rep29]|uniref:SDR family NAD(P)-dependent oxidoreductase n=1 Tax=Prevotella sp. Rep29 TaxID=2691580 RepID=UPI001C6E6773|nr:SDR family oxidoreductase [Prevotella sp. Rep29]QYR10296.1 SDR family oxidoreductase [Prevotella sp. Rep29]